LSHRWDARVGVSDFDFSNAFIVPSNAGMDAMMYEVVLATTWGSARAIKRQARESASASCACQLEAQATAPL
jgi:hypothetical protein